MTVLMPVQKHKLINKIIREFLSQSLVGKNKNLSQEEANRIADEGKHYSRNNGLQVS